MYINFIILLKIPIYLPHNFSLGQNYCSHNLWIKFQQSFEEHFGHNTLWIKCSLQDPLNVPSREASVGMVVWCPVLGSILLQSPDWLITVQPSTRPPLTSAAVNYNHYLKLVMVARYICRYLDVCVDICRYNYWHLSGDGQAVFAVLSVSGERI